MTTTMAQGSRIEIRGFGAFRVKELAPRLGRNLRNGEPVQVPGRRVTHFKPGKALKEAVEREVEDAH